MPAKPRTQWIVLTVVLVLLAGSLVWNFQRATTQETSTATASASDFVVRWVCMECGHETEDRAGPGPHECPECGKRTAYAQLYFTCATHGTVPVFLNYDNKGIISEIHVGDTGWKPEFEQDGTSNLVCPQCGMALMPQEQPRLADEPPPPDFES